MTENILIDLDVVLSNIKSMVAGLAEFPIADEVRVFHEAFGGLTAADAPAAGAPVAANVLPVLPSATKGTVQ